MLYMCVTVPVLASPQCTMDADCPSKLACFSGNCRNPCIETKPCASHATCMVVDSLPLRTMVCQCDTGYVGDADVACKLGNLFNYNRALHLKKFLIIFQPYNFLRISAVLYKKLYQTHFITYTILNNLYIQLLFLSHLGIVLLLSGSFLLITLLIVFTSYSAS